MTTEQKLNKLIDLLIEYSEDWNYLSDPNQRLFLNNLYCKLKELKTEEIKPDVTTSEEMVALSYGEGIKVATATASESSLATARLNVDSNNATSWLPNPGDGYYTIHPTYNVPIKLYWGNPKPTMGEMALYKLGLIFKTQEEVMAKINSLLNL